MNPDIFQLLCLIGIAISGATGWTPGVGIFFGLIVAMYIYLAGQGSK